MKVVRLDSAGIASLDAAAWDRLSAVAAVPNPFYSRRHVLAGLATIDRAAGLQAAAVFAADGRLVGLFPHRRAVGSPLPWCVAQGAANPYQFCGMPLVDADALDHTVTAWLRAMAAGELPRRWTLTHFDLASPLGAALTRAAAARGFALRPVAGYARPRLTRLAGGFAAHVETVIPRRRLKDLERNLRGLRQTGEVAFERTDDPALLGRRLEQFLALEHAGWKGRRGTSFLADPAAADFARRAYGEAAPGEAVIDSLLLDGEPIAISVNIAAGRTLFTPKCAYDERWRRYGPGLVLEYLAIERFYADQRFDAVDAATTVDGHVVSALWNDHRQMTHLVAGPDDWRTTALAGFWRRAIGAQEAAKRAFQGAEHAAAPAAATGRGHVAAFLSRVRNRVPMLFGAATLALVPSLLWIKRHQWAADMVPGI